MFIFLYITVEAEIIILAKMLNLLRHWFYISTKFDLSSKVTHIGTAFTYLSIFFSEFNWLLELKFHMEYSVDKTI